MAYTIFRIPVGYRLYDREKNKVVHLQEEEYRALERIGRREGTEKDGSILRRIQQKGFCRESTLSEIEHPATKTVQALIETKVKQLVLQVTQNCNLRCSYCAYSGNYYNRRHNGKRMTLDTALRAVDFLMAHSSGVDEVAVGFYGGEPLLEFALIQKVIAYVEAEYAVRKVRFVITSNLTLFTEEVIDYLLEKKVQLMISIDGPRSVQDKYRVFTNGKGSYDEVVANAERIREKSPEYFQQCATNTVASPGEDYESIRAFLDTDPLFGPLNSTLTQVSDSGLKEEVEYSDDFFRMARREKFKVFLYLLGEIGSDKISRLYIGSKVALLQANQTLNSGGTENIKKGHPGGPCLPGIKRVFVDVDGNFYPCERISEYERFQIGNLDRGFDFDRVKGMINVGRYTEQECLHCWAFLFCGTCIANMVDGDEPTREMRLRRCAGVREGAAGKLADLETVKHYGFHVSEEESEGEE